MTVATARSSSARAHYRFHDGVALNDLEVSPGEVRGIKRSDICNQPAGWTDEFRATTEKMKEEVYAAYGVDKHKFNRALFCTGNVKCDSAAEWAKKNAGHKTPLPLYEIDHLDSLQLDGADTIVNMMPQPYYAHPGAHEKDAVENWARKQVCANPPKMDLQEGQRRIATDWYALYIEMMKLPSGMEGARLGPEHWQCDVSNDCELVQNKLSADGRPELSPLGCFLAKTRITWILGDRTSMCVKNGAN